MLGGLYHGFGDGGTARFKRQVTPNLSSFCEAPDVCVVQYRTKEHGTCSSDRELAQFRLQCIRVHKNSSSQDEFCGRMR